MKTEEASSLAPGFASWEHPEKLKFFGWHLHTHKSRATFTARDIELCYEETHLIAPANIYRDLARLAGKKPPVLLGDSKGYRLERRIREDLDAKYGRKSATLKLAADLEQLPDFVTNTDEKVFLDETIACLRAPAFRAAIGMAWNLAFSHILNFILKDPTRLADFNTWFEKLYEKNFKKEGPVLKYDDFGDKLREFDTLRIAKSAGLVSNDVGKLLDEKLGKRNSAAHPSSMVFERRQAENYVEDLVINVVLKIK